MPNDAENIMVEAFRVTEPSGKTYVIYANGQVDGFEQPAIVRNRIPMLIRAHQRNIVNGSPLPMDRLDPARGGASHSFAPNGASDSEKISAAPGEK